MSEELKRFIEDAIYKWIKKQLDESNYTANLRIEIDNPIEVKGMKGRVVGEIILGNRSDLPIQPMPAEPPAESEKKADSQPKGEEMSLQEVEKLLRSLGV